MSIYAFHKQDSEKGKIAFLTSVITGEAMENVPVAPQDNSDDLTAIDEDLPA